MTTYARIVDGVVLELYTTPEGVPIAECFTTEIAAQFIAVPDGVSPQQGWSYSGGTFAAPAVPPAPTLAQQAAGMLAAGIQITSASAPTLDGTYACDPATYQRISGIVAGIAAGLGLPGDGATFNWPDAPGTPHAFSSAQFTAFAKAVRDFEYALNTIIGSNSGTLPTLPVAIA